MKHFETLVQDHLTKILNRPASESKALHMDQDLRFSYGLTSLDRIILMTDVCKDAGVALTSIDEDEIAALHTPCDIVNLISRKAVNR